MLMLKEKIADYVGAAIVLVNLGGAMLNSAVAYDQNEEMHDKSALVAEAARAQDSVGVLLNLRAEDDKESSRNDHIVLASLNGLTAIGLGTVVLVNRSRSK